MTIRCLKKKAREFLIRHAAKRKIEDPDWSKRLATWRALELDL